MPKPPSPQLTLTDLALCGWYDVLRLFDHARDELELAELRRISADYRRALDLMAGAAPRKARKARVPLNLPIRPIKGREGA